MNFVIIALLITTQIQFIFLIYVLHYYETASQAKTKLIVVENHKCGSPSTSVACFNSWMVLNGDRPARFFVFLFPLFHLPSLTLPTLWASWRVSAWWSTTNQGWYWILSLPEETSGLITITLIYSWMSLGPCLLHEGCLGECNDLLVQKYGLHSS